MQENTEFGARNANFKRACENIKGGCKRGPRCSAGTQTWNQNIPQTTLDRRFSCSLHYSLNLREGEREKREEKDGQEKGTISFFLSLFSSFFPFCLFLPLFIPFQTLAFVKSWFGWQCFYLSCKHFSEKNLLSGEKILK